MKLCSCGSDNTYANCCEVFINNKKLPVTPEQLMRSRYTAYTKANIDYIMQTMKSPAADHFDRKSAKKWAQHCQWLKLEIIQTSTMGDRGFVEFRAHFLQNNKLQILHEVSEFRLEGGRWFYIDGKLPNDL